jgi:DeoR family fructose operon transcriptional repressor
MLTEISQVASKRQREILRRAYLQESLKVRYLAQEYKVHEMTIRRDFDELCRLGHLERTHGGARLNERSGEEISHQLRATRHRPEKDLIARLAVDLIQPGETVALDASTTSLSLARIIGLKGVRVITSSLEVANVLAGAGATFILTGGEYNPGTRSFVGGFVQDAIHRLHPDKVFFSSKACSIDAGFTDSALPEVEIKSALIKSGASVIALIDHSKFNRRALATLASLSQVDTIVTDRRLSEEMNAAFADAQVTVLIPEVETDPKH